MTIDLECELRRAAMLATAGDWRVYTHDDEFVAIEADPPDGDRSKGRVVIDSMRATADAAYIAIAAPNSALALLDTIDHLRAEVNVLKKYRSERFDRAEQDQAWADAVATWKLQAGQRGNECVALFIEREKLRAALTEALVEWKAWLDDQRYTSMSMKDDEAIARLSKLLPVTP